MLCRELFDALDRCESILAGSRYLVGNTLTEADVRLFMTLVRFDHVSCMRGGSACSQQQLQLALLCRVAPARYNVVTFMSDIRPGTAPTPGAVSQW